MSVFITFLLDFTTGIQFQCCDPAMNLGEQEYYHSPVFQLMTPAK